MSKVEALAQVRGCAPVSAAGLPPRPESTPAALRILWLGRFYPQLPLKNGAALHSYGLIAACAAQGASVEVVCLNGRPGTALSRPATADVAWRVVDGRMPSLTRRLLSLLPTTAAGFETRGYKHAVAEALGRGPWDAVVCDSLALASHLLPIARQVHGRAALVYLAHNHETSTWTLIARCYRGSWLTKLGIWLNARKTARLERRTLRACDLVVAITDEDAARFKEQQPGKAMITVRPGHAGARAVQRDPSRAKRAVLLLGSYEWIAKRSNIESFLAAAERRLSDAGIEVRVVGSMTPDFQQRLRRRFPRATIVGPVGEIASELERARMGLVIEKAGGGF